MSLSPNFHVASTGASPVVYYVHTDQLGTPQKMTDANDNVVWDSVFDPFGNIVANTGANWGTGIWGSFTWEPTTPETMLLRFPGQYADAETALNQNWFRDYDPTIGRYIESDPIGLDAGINTYTYVLGDPVGLVDPNGTGVVGGIIGGIIGGIGGAVGGGAVGAAAGTAIEPGGGTAVGAGYGGYEGAIAGAEEGAAIGSGLENLIDLLSRRRKDCFDDCRNQWIDDTRWCDNNTEGYENVACHEHALDNFDRCKNGLPRIPWIR